MERSPLVQVVKRMVCLANSRKLAGRCVAGRLLEDCQPKGWVRPVSNREHEEVSEYERQYYDGSDPKLLDVIDVPLLEPRPKNYQPENWLLDPEAYWEKISQVSSKDLDHLTDPVADLWTNGMHTVPGNNDRFDVRDNQLEYSLRFIKLPALRLLVCVPGVAFGNHKRRVQDSSSTTAKNTDSGSQIRNMNVNTRSERLGTTTLANALQLSASANRWGVTTTSLLLL